MRLRATLLFALMTLVSCSNDDNGKAITLSIAGCGVDKPLEELLWLKTEIESREANTNEDMKYCYIVQGTVNNSTVFIYKDCNPLVDKIVLIYDCEGTPLDADGWVSPNSV